MTSPGEFFDLLPSTSTISNAISDALSSSVGTILNNTLGRILYLIVSAISYLISLAYQLFEAFSGQIKISYKGEDTFLTNVFFENSTISGIYWGMAIIGVVLCFAFTIITVIRKMFDSADKVQASLGTILGSMFRSILLILSMNVVLVVVLNFTNVLMQQVIYVFNAGSSLTESQRIDFTDDQFATMGRVLNTIGNYSLNPSYNSRYNLNSCFNEIRGDMRYLQQQGVFDFYYYTEDAKGNEVTTWQSALQTLVFAANLDEELKMDVYYESVSNALLEIMETLKTNTAFYPLEYFERDPIPIGNIPFDRVLFLACTYNAALNEQFNVNPSHTDALRGPYYNGQKSIYDFVQVSKDFNLIWGFNYIVFFLVVYGILKQMMYILLDCVARIYNMVMLYLVAPPFIALTPLDGGGKMKQWTLAFVVQCFGIFGTVISMRLMLTFAPIVIGTDLQIFSNPIMDITAKVIMIDAATLACTKTSGIFTGILSDSSGWQSISAGNLRNDYDQREKEKQAEENSKQQQMQQAKSAAKLAAGGGDLKDLKNVASAEGPAVKALKGDNKDNKAGSGDKDNKPEGGNKDNKPEGGNKDNKPEGGNKDNKPEGGNKDNKPEGGNKDNKPEGGNKDNKPTGSTFPKPIGSTTPKPTGSTVPKPTGSTVPKPTGSTAPKPTGSTAPKPTGSTAPKPTGSTPPKTNSTGGPKSSVSTTGGFQGIPVAPDISKTNHYGQPPAQPKQEDNNGQGTQPEQPNLQNQNEQPVAQPNPQNQNEQPVAQPDPQNQNEQPVAQPDPQNPPEQQNMNDVPVEIGEQAQPQTEQDIPPATNDNPGVVDEVKQTLADTQPVTDNMVNAQPAVNTAPGTGGTQNQSPPAGGTQATFAAQQPPAGTAPNMQTGNPVTQTNNFTVNTIPTKAAPPPRPSQNVNLGNKVGGNQNQ